MTKRFFPEGVDASLMLERHGCVVWVDRGELHGCEANDFASAGSVTAAIAKGVSYVITAPVSERFLSSVNFGLGTDFTMSDFSGR